jgi:hypothetical protein
VTADSTFTRVKGDYGITRQQLRTTAGKQGEEKEETSFGFSLTFRLRVFS